MEVTVEQANSSFLHIPPSLFIIQKGWPFFCNKLKVRVIVVKHGNGPGKHVSSVHGGLALPTHLDPPQMHLGACGGLGILPSHGAPFP